MSVFNCIHPKYVTNIRGELIKVRCGQCEACTNTKSLSYTTQCKLETLAHKYCMFVTLTYSNEHLPLVRAYQKHGDLFFFPTSPRLYEHFANNERFAFAYSPCAYFNNKSLSVYYNKFALPEHLKGLIPVLDKVDVQLFMKRLRKRIYKATNEKIRYFACGEYGPVHFRPHYHLLLWFDNPKTLSVMGKSIFASWKYGRVDYSLSRGNTASYTASYSNSISVRSRLHAIKHLRPFVLHSSRLYGSLYQSEEEAVYENDYDRIANKFYTDNGKAKPVYPLLSFESSFFARCLNYDKISHSDRLECYCFAERSREEFGDYPASTLAHLVWSHPESKCHQILKRIAFDGKFKESTVLSVLYVSRRFFRNCGDYCVSPRTMLRHIEDYWTRKDYCNLRAQLEKQEEFTFECSPENRIFLLFFYDNFIFKHNDPNTPPTYSTAVRNYIESLGYEPNFITDFFIEFDKNPLFAEFAAFHRKLSRDLVKHKKLNDLNKIFL